MTQKQKYTKIHSDMSEHSTCPFCGHDTIGHYKTAWSVLCADSVCIHFVDYIMGAHGKTTAMYQGSESGVYYTEAQQ